MTSPCFARSRRRAQLVAILAVVLTACAGNGSEAPSGSTTTATPATTSTTTTLPPPATWPEVPAWAEPGIAWMEAYRTALNSGGVESVYPFLSENVFWFGNGSEPGVARTGMRDVLTTLLGDAAADDPPQHLPGPVFFRWMGTPWGIGTAIDWIHHVAPPEEGCEPAPGCPGARSVHVEVSPEGVMIHRSTTLVADLRAGTDHGLGPVSLDDVEAQYRDIGARFSSGDVDRIAGMITDEVVYVDAGDGTLTTIVPREQFREAFTGILSEYPDMQVVELTTADLGLDDRADPAVFYTADSNWSDAVDEWGGTGIYELTLREGASVLIAVDWLNRDGAVVSLQWAFDPVTMTALPDDGNPPPMEMEASHWPPIPGPQRIETGTITTPDGDVTTLYNASDAHRALVEWALDRFVAAGLDPPSPRSVGFPPDMRCALYAGVAVDTGEGVDLQLCFDEMEVCGGDAGGDTDDCTPSVSARSTLLHELAHVWTGEHVDDTTRAAFLAVRGLETWQGEGLSRDDSGTEHAAEILAWGLLDTETWDVRLPNSGCEDLAGGFRTLTGSEPLRVCSG